MKSKFKRIIGKFVEGILFIYCKIVYRLKIVGTGSATGVASTTGV